LKEEEIARFFNTRPTNPERQRGARLATAA